LVVVVVVAERECRGGVGIIVGWVAHWKGWGSLQGMGLLSIVVIRVVDPVIISDGCDGDDLSWWFSVPQQTFVVKVLTAVEATRRSY